jgi:nucleoside-diphosphate-sugar epimerase
MHIVIFGANDPIGRNLTKQALDAGHTVVAVTHHPEALPNHHDRLQAQSAFHVCLPWYYPVRVTFVETREDPLFAGARNLTLATHDSCFLSDCARESSAGVGWLKM